jgi:hypothetical protein
MDELERMAPDELAFLAIHGTPEGSLDAWLAMCGRRDIDAHAAVEDARLTDIEIVQDEPLPAFTRPDDLAVRQEFAWCVGWEEAHAIMRHRPHEERLRARYRDLYERELHFGWDVPDFDTWAAEQD